MDSNKNDKNIPLYRGSGNAAQSRIVPNDHSLGGSSSTGDNRIEGVVSDVNVAVGDIVYIDSTGVALRAQANSVITSNVVAVCIAKASATSCTIQLTGITSNVFAGLTPGLTYFLSPSTAGSLTTTVPTTAGQIVTPVGKAYNSQSLIVNVQLRLIRS